MDTMIQEESKMTDETTQVEMFLQCQGSIAVIG
jgi:hypothetical protein